MGNFIISKPVLSCFESIAENIYGWDIYVNCRINNFSLSVIQVQNKNLEKYSSLKCLRRMCEHSVEKQSFDGLKKGKSSNQ